jgi:CMP-2-keto-3-deoxyoctulosonic acid synthetase
VHHLLREREPHRLPRRRDLALECSAPSPLEHTENLEQLRLIEAGIGIDTFQVEGESLSADTA